MRNGLIVWDIEEIIMFINRNKKPNKDISILLLQLLFLVFASALSEVTIFCFLVDN